MDLAGTLGLGDRALVAFVGAGGKKTAMGRLVEEGVEHGLAVGYTTTTHLPPPDLPVVVSQPESIEVTLEGQPPPVAFAREWVEQPERSDEKLQGFSTAVVDWVYHTRRFDWLVVKADGARRRGFKAPGSDEPALPEATTDVVAVASIQVVGKTLDAAHVHRPERVADLTDLELGDVITAEAVGTVLASPDGGLKHVTDSMEVSILLNQADTPTLWETARDVLEVVTRHSRPIRGVVSSFRTGEAEVVIEPG